MNKQEFLKSFSEALGIKEDVGLTVDTLFKQLENWGSLSTVSLIVMVEEKYGKEITPMQIRKCSSIGDIINVIEG